MKTNRNIVVEFQYPGIEASINQYLIIHPNFHITSMVSYESDSKVYVLVSFEPKKKIILSYLNSR